jgi:glycosyltransferase involved in cell wall biosynthesis
MKLPSISIISLTYNPDPHIFKKVLDSINFQNYPKNRIEHLIMDGGSTNGALTMARKYGCTICFLPAMRDNSEGRKGLGIARAKNDLIAFIEADNILVGREWLKQMVAPFSINKRIVGTFSMHNTYLPGMPALTRYCALIGVNDPTVYYLGKSEKLTRFQKRYTKGTTLRDFPSFSIVRFTKDSLPTLGDNGHMVRRRLMQLVNSDPGRFLHTDAFVKLLFKKYDTYGIVKNSIIHVTGSNIFGLYKRRVFFKKQFYDFGKKQRLYYVFNPHSKRDRWLLARFIVYSLTFVEPIIFSIRGFIAVQDAAWFLHPFVCFVAVMSYGLSELRLFWLTYIMRIPHEA